MAEGPVAVGIFAASLMVLIVPGSGVATVVARSMDPGDPLDIAAAATRVSYGQFCHGRRRFHSCFGVPPVCPWRHAHRAQLKDCIVLTRLPAAVRRSRHRRHHAAGLCAASASRCIDPINRRRDALLAGGACGPGRGRALRGIQRRAVRSGVGPWPRGMHAKLAERSSQH